MWQPVWGNCCSAPTRPKYKNYKLAATTPNTESFIYVLNPSEKPRVAFGSGIERDTLPLQGPAMSPFMRRQMGDVLLTPGPVSRLDNIDHVEIKNPSKMGKSPFASKLSRLTTTQNSTSPSVGAYEVEKKKTFKNAAKPFNVGSLRAELTTFLTPAPNTYLHRLMRPQVTVDTAFGTQRKISPTVQIICSPTNAAQCFRCHQQPQGDYWCNIKNNLVLCRPCRHKTVQQLGSCKITEVLRLQLLRALQHYRLTRYCGFFHDHNGTTAAIQLITTKTLKLKIRMENYLSLYM